VNDPLHIASSDHPGMMLTTTTFNGSNFLGWSRTIKMVLGAKLKLGFIDGSLPKPAAIDNNYQRWIRCDYMVVCWILNSMIAELSDSFLYAQSAFDLWKELEERYGQSNGPLIYHIERELSKVTQGNLTVAAYFNKLKRFWDELHSLNGIPLCSCGKMKDCPCGITEKFLEIDSRSKLMHFLMKLNDEFESVRNQILSMDPLPNINKAYYIVQQVEKQKQVTHHQFFEEISYPDWYKGKKGKKQGVKLATQVSSDFDQYLPREAPFQMDYENEVIGAKVDLDQKLVDVVCQEMMKLIKGKGIDVNEASSSKPHAGILLSSKDTKTGLSLHASIKFLIDNGGLNIEIYWVVDTGASDHMCPYLHLFQCIRILKKPIKIKLPVDFKDPSTRQVLAAGEGFRNLYICKPSSPKTSSDSFPLLSSFVNKVVQPKVNDVSVDLFHSRLGHTSVSKLPFPLSQTRSKIPLELVHVDLWGPYKVSALNGANYFLTIVDDNTRCTWTYLVHTKDQIHDILSCFFSYIKNHYNGKPMFIRSENGTKIVNKACLALFNSLGIVHQRSMVYTPQQNGVVERKHRHLLDTVRALKLHANLPNKFWGDCILAATYC
ncbi:NSP-interacting kinase 1-like protein, partial [Tanacetum coccineum]